MQGTTVDDWPTPYIPAELPSPHRRPGLVRPVIRKIADAFVSRMLDDSKAVAIQYRDIVVTARNDPNDHAVDFLDLLLPSIMRGGGDFSVANEHDFANIHRSAWLLIYETIVRLLNYNIHGDWGDPPAGRTAHGEDDPPIQQVDSLLRFHDIPNTTGFYAMSTLDYPAPNTGVGSAAPALAPKIVHPERSAVFAGGSFETPQRRIRRIAFAFARRLVAAPADGEDYLREVKAYFRDRTTNHTANYAEIIGRALHVPESLDDDDVAEVHRATWLLLVNRFSMLVGNDVFGPLDDVPPGTRSVPLPNTLGGPQTFEVPNAVGSFSVNLGDIDS